MITRYNLYHKLIVKYLTLLSFLPFPLLAQCDLTNKVINGDFSSGFAEFSTSYTNCNGYLCLSDEGLFTVNTDPTSFHVNFQGKDHTTGNGNFMMVNGTGTPNTIVWQQTINNLKPGTVYHFSAWISNLSGHTPALIQFMINGQPLGNVLTTPDQRLEWENFYTQWNSENNTSATISILDQNTVAFGNDFGVDDISFVENCALPVDFIQFNATAKNMKAELQWAVSEKDKANYFIIEKSTDGVHFEIARNIPAEKTVDAQTSYNYSEDLKGGITYFRIAAFEEDGSVSYSPIESCSLNNDAFRIYPNPARNFFTIAGKFEGAVTEISLLNLLGEELWKDLSGDLNHYREKTYDISNLPKGVYFVHIKTSNKLETRKIVKE